MRRELMHADLALANRVIFDHAVASQPGGRRQDHVVADDAVVRDVRVSHYQRVTADFCQHSAAFGAAVDRCELANHVVVADFDDRRFALEFQILRFRADRGELPDAIALADGGVALDHRARADRRARANLNARSDHRARTDFDARVEFGALVDDRGGMDSSRYRTCSSTSIADNSASAASSSPTRATACIRHSGR